MEAIEPFVDARARPGRRRTTSLVNAPPGHLIVHPLVGTPIDFKLTLARLWAAGFIACEQNF